MDPNLLDRLFAEASKIAVQGLPEVPIEDEKPEGEVDVALFDNKSESELYDEEEDEDEEDTAQQDEQPSALEEEVSFDSSCSRSIEELESFKKKLIDDERLSQIYKLKYNFSERFDNRAYIHPHGMTNFDYKAIAEERKAGFEKFKNRVRQENYAYLGQHPEIGAMISLLVKKLIQVQPPDPGLYLADFFNTRLSGSRDFEDVLDAEIKRISRYRVNKMKAAGRIVIKPGTAMKSEEAGEPFEKETDANYLKKLNIGPLAQDFYFGDGMAPKRKTVKEEVEEKPKRKGKKKPYCGCKDWKLKKNRKGKETNGGGDGGGVDPNEEEEDEYEEELDFEGETEEDASQFYKPTAEQIANEIMDGLDGYGSGFFSIDNE